MLTNKPIELVRVDENLFDITMVSNLSGDANTRRIAAPEAAVMQLMDDDRPHIQDLFPDLSKEDREFLLSGMTPEEWDVTFNFGGEDDEDDDEDADEDEDEDALRCAECGRLYTVSETGVSSHVSPDGGSDHDVDAHHVAYGAPEAQPPPSTREALQCLVNYLEQNPDLYEGDDDNVLGRLMHKAYAALKHAGDAPCCAALAKERDALGKYVVNHQDEALRAAVCHGCGAAGFDPSPLGPDRCSRCGGTEGGVGPGSAEFEKDQHIELLEKQRSDALRVLMGQNCAAASGREDDIAFITKVDDILTKERANEPNKEIS